MRFFIISILDFVNQTTGAAEEDDVREEDLAKNDIGLETMRTEL